MNRIVPIAILASILAGCSSTKQQPGIHSTAEHAPEAMLQILERPRKKYSMNLGQLPRDHWYRASCAESLIDRKLVLILAPLSDSLTREIVGITNDKSGATTFGAWADMDIPISDRINYYEGTTDANKTMDDD